MVTFLVRLLFPFIYSEVFNVRQTGTSPSEITTILRSSNGTLTGSNILPSYEAYTALNYTAAAALSSHIFE